MHAAQVVVREAQTDSRFQMRQRGRHQASYALLGHYQTGSSFPSLNLREMPLGDVEVSTQFLLPTPDLSYTQFRLHRYTIYK
jgi:hypothetical protein